MKKVCMIVQDPMVKGGIAAVVNGYRGSQLEKDYKIIYVESYKDGSKATKLLKAMKGYIHFAKVLLVDKPDLVHIHSSFGPSFYRKIPFVYMAWWAKCPIINHIHGADFDEFYVSAGEKKRMQIKRVYEKCAVIIALSQEWKEQLTQIIPAEKIVVVNNYSILHEDALKERLCRECNNTVLFLGELGKRKGCYDIPEVAGEVLRAVPGARFILGGAGLPEEETTIKKIFSDKGLSDHVTFPGWVRGEEKDKLLREADVFFLPSYNEGMPMSVLDAIGYGLPVVSTNVGGIPKIVHHEESGFCCEVGDTKGFADRIIELLMNKEKRESAARACIMIAKKDCSREVHLQQLENIYEEVSV